jgi:hypothetical protein
MKHSMKVIVDTELSRICHFMDLRTLTFSFEKEEWIAIGKIFLLLVVKRLEKNVNEKD